MKGSKMAWVYILQCKDGAYYTGSTLELEKRVAEHQGGEGGAYTSVRLPVRLVYCYQVATVEEAFYLERQIKGWRREKKEALIRGDYSALVRLAQTATLRRTQGGSGRRAER